MPSRNLPLLMIGLLGLSACAGSNATQTCAGYGFSSGSPQYRQCLENMDMHKMTADRAMLKTNVNQPVGVPVEPYSRPFTPVINCTTYSKPIPGSPSLCD